MTKLIFALATAVFVTSASATAFGDAIKIQTIPAAASTERAAEPVKSTAPVQSQKTGAVEKSNDKGAVPPVSATKTKTTNQSSDR